MKKEIEKNKDKSLEKSSKDVMHRPEYEMVVSKKMSTQSKIIALIAYTVGVIFVTLHFAKQSCF